MRAPYWGTHYQTRGPRITFLIELVLEYPISPTPFLLHPGRVMVQLVLKQSISQLGKSFQTNSISENGSLSRALGQRTPFVPGARDHCGLRSEAAD